MAESLDQLDFATINQVLKVVNAIAAQLALDTTAIDAIPSLIGPLAAEQAQMAGVLVTMNTNLTGINAKLDIIIAALFPPDVASFNPTLVSITKQQRSSEMADKVHSFASGAGTLLDDDMGTIQANPLQADGVTPAVLPAGMVPTYTPDVTTFGTLDPTGDPTGATCKWTSVKGQAGVTTVTIASPTPNADGTTPAPGTIVITTSIDPSEQDVASFGPTLVNVTKQ